MKNSETGELFELSGLMSRGYSSLIANAGKVIAVITLAVAVMVTFTDVAFSDLASERFTTTLAVMLASSYLMYFSLLDAGEREGELTEAYRAASEKYTEARGRITPDDIDALREFCLSYSMRELEYRRLSYLGERGYSRSEFESYRAGERVSPRAKRAFRKADRMKAVKLTPQTLMSRSHRGEGGELSDPKRKKLYGALVSLIPSTVCMVFTISVILTAKDDLTVSTVIDGLVKLAALPIIGLKGMLDGFKFATEDRSGWLETKARLLSGFCAEK